MQRRTFLQSAAASSAFMSLKAQESIEGVTDDQSLLDSWVKVNDRRVSDLLKLQVKDSGHPKFGGFPDRHEIFHVSTAAQGAKHLVLAYLSPQSAFYESERVEAAVDRAIGFLRREQHDDGTIDLVTTNFHSTPDTGFVVEPLAISVGCIRKWNGTRLRSFQEQSMKFLRSAGRALCRGGIHTPNHRWVVSMALARIHALEPDPAYTRRIDQWLAERIDIDPDGQYTEYSTSIYSPLVNRCLITMARLLGRPRLYDPVRKNLNLTRYLIRSSGELVTETSKRQDQYRVTTAEGYYFAYRTMALLDQNPAFSAVARFIQSACGLEKLVDMLAHFLEDDSIRRPLPSGGKLLDDYEKHFHHSRQVRIRRQETDLSVLAGNDRILTMQKRGAALQALRLCSAFFGKGQFLADELTVADGLYVLKQHLLGPYYQPLSPADIPGDGDWSKMPRSLRTQSEIQHLDTEIKVRERAGQLSIQFHVRGTDHVPVAIELSFRHGGQLRAAKENQLIRVPDIDDAYLLKSGQATYQLGDQQISFGPGRMDHRWTQLRGARPKLAGQSVYLTSFTPFQFELSLA